MYFIIFIIGLCVGSFLNVVIDRLSNEQSLGGRSYCDHCKKTLSWKDLIPVVSYLILQGRSSCCRKKISLYYPIVELVTALFFILTFQLKGLDWAQFGIISSLIVIFFADLKYRIIPDQATAGLVIFSLPAISDLMIFLDRLVAGVSLMFLLYLLYFFTKKRGLGFGDVKLGFAIGFIQGIKFGFVSIYLGFLIGGIVSVILLISKLKTAKSKIAFGPFLVLGILLTNFFGQNIIQIWKGLWY